MRPPDYAAGSRHLKGPHGALRMAQKHELPARGRDDKNVSRVRHLAVRLTCHQNASETTLWGPAATVDSDLGRFSDNGA
jgi:hypothetical protein